MHLSDIPLAQTHLYLDTNLQRPLLLREIG